MRFPTFAASVDYVAQQIAQQYLSQTGKFYGGAATLRGMHYYASDPHWAQAIVGIAVMIGAAGIVNSLAFVGAMVP